MFRCTMFMMGGWRGHSDIWIRKCVMYDLFECDNEDSLLQHIEDWVQLNLEYKLVNRHHFPHYPVEGQVKWWINRMKWSNSGPFDCIFLRFPLEHQARMFFDDHFKYEFHLHPCWDWEAIKQLIRSRPFLYDHAPYRTGRVGRPSQTPICYFHDETTLMALKLIYPEYFQ